MKEVLGANPVAINFPIGAEESFKGVVDLIRMKAILWHDETMGAEYEVEDIPADLVDMAEEYRSKLLENAARLLALCQRNGIKNDMYTYSVKERAAAVKLAKKLLEEAGA